MNRGRHPGSNCPPRALITRCSEPPPASSSHRDAVHPRRPAPRAGRGREGHAARPRRRCPEGAGARRRVRPRRPGSARSAPPGGPVAGGLRVRGHVPARPPGGRRLLRLAPRAHGRGARGPHHARRRQGQGRRRGGSSWPPVRAVLRTSAREDDQARALATAPATLGEDLEETGTFVTLLHARLDSPRAWSPAPTRARTHAARPGDGSSRRIATRRLPLGALRDTTWSDVPVPLRPGRRW